MDNTLNDILSMDKGRKSFKAGDTILVDKPFVHALKSTFKNEKCDQCYSENNLSRCSGCQYVLYCNRTCQKVAWKEHKRECSRMKKIQPKTLPDAARIISKILISLKNGGNMQKSYYTTTRYRTFKDLMSHYPDLKKDEKRLEHFTSLFEVLKEYMGESNLPNTVELLGIYGRMCINAFNILDDNLNTIGTGIYLGASVLNHSCVPNATATFDGTTLRIKAVTDIENSDPELHVYISYLELMQTNDERRRELQNNYYFLCECKRCLTEDEHTFISSMTCSNVKCQAPVPMKLKRDEVLNSVNCPECLEIVSETKVKEFYDVTEYTEFQLLKMKDIGYLDVCKMCLKKQNSVFHSSNINHVKILDLAFESAIKMELWAESLKYGISLIEGYKSYYGEYHPSLGILYMKLFKLSSIVENAETAVKYLKKGSSILKVTHGEDHSLYRNEVIPYCNELFKYF
ncbi:histone-lysine N-methyltransferase SMYD3 [Adelges cooleyi]|uniref:histone-lysine N-methyltransferase SMYD3 n=1 Tax=Adelges cooleyi TaxID=133065 RepID=UPI00217F4CE8|nr:histone-lysine N-methyltransferase SMYD3 [Adelges cooleyi]XP_050441461.1 histone-lysine N-methyltransferase SMYD3 [Adelges cooleyi]